MLLLYTVPNYCNHYYIKTKITNLVRTARFWNNLHQVHSKKTYLKAK